MKGIRNLLIGLGVGVGLGLLFAPRSGSELRDDISGKAKDIAESTRERFYRLRKKVESEAENPTGTEFR